MHDEIIPSAGLRSAVTTLDGFSEGKESEALAAAGLVAESSEPVSGLVNCAKTQRAEIPDDVSGVHAEHFRFPSGWAVRVAAESFPVADGTGRAKTATRVPGKIVTLTDQVDAGGLPYVLETSAHQWHAVNESAEGPWPTIEVAPGLVRLRRTDPARRDRQMERLRQRDLTARAQNTALEDFDANEGYWDETLDDAEPVGTAGRVSRWSQKSQVRMQATIRELDLHAFLNGQTPAITTLTLPGRWGAIMPDAATASKVFNRFQVAYRRAWGTPVWIWKREFQGRGAPHWHLWMIPPTKYTDEAIAQAEKSIWTPLLPFRDWVRYAWAAAMRLTPPANHPTSFGVVESCSCRDGGGRRPEYCASIGAGTNVDYAEGVRASDPQRLATYFLKESAGSTGKQYQNSIPWAWSVHGVDYSIGEQGPLPRPGTKVARFSVGRFWGRSNGLEKVLASVSVAPDAAVQLWRMMRKAQWGRRLAWTSDTHGVVVRTGLAEGVKKPGRIVRHVPKDVDMETGEVGTIRVRRRPVNRVRASSASAGWVGVNDGPRFALDLSRYLTGEPNRMKPAVAAAVPGSRRAYLAEKHRPLPIPEIWETF